MPKPTLTYTTALVLDVLARGYRYGFDIMSATGLPSGTVYPILRRLERARCVTSNWESDATAEREQRPARRYYVLTAAGVAMRKQAVARFHGLAGSRTSPA